LNKQKKPAANIVSAMIMLRNFDFFSKFFNVSAPYYN